MQKTLFQKIADKEIPAAIVYEDELCVAFRDIAPAAPVHVLLVPRKPIPDIAAATAEDAALLAHLMLKVGDIARAEGLAEGGFRTVMNTGEQAGQTVPHLHIHIIGGRSLQWPPG
ncbi:MAG: histidine triad nucleotide-binding protein [Akkermansia sp.]|nr:histidine triad nucleotide-binding protein [Akkermansiaceae bacterium]MBQ2813580.1 histidine triad nucleotide-binding protein [Akkermansia sp.]